MQILIYLGIAFGALIALIIFLCSIYKVADVDKALIITGGKEPVIKVSGGSFVIPIFRKASSFDLCMLTVKASGDSIITGNSVPIVIDWTAQIRPDISDISKLKKCIISFKERGKQQIIEDVKETLTGSVRNVVASMTPEGVLKNKEEFATSVTTNVNDELENMGLELVSLNIQDITDNNGYYDNIAAIGMEEKRREAEKVRATTDQQIRQQTAESEKIAKQSELDTELHIAEKAKDNALKKAEFKTETDKANADAAVAGRLQQTIRLQEVAEQEGKVEVVRQEQANLAALKEKDVIKTRAEAERIRAEIKAQEEAQVSVIDAEAKTKVTEQEAKMATINAEARAKVMEQEAIGRATAIEKEAAANANKIKLEGETEADIIAKKGAAEAEAERAILLAKAEGEKALAEARAGNDKVNFEIEKLKIEANARIEIATKTAQIMADLGKNAEFVNIGGAASGQNTGNVLLDTLSGIPGLMKVLNAENNALNGENINDTVNGLVSSVASPLKGLLVNNTNVES